MSKTHHIDITPELAAKLIAEQFPEYAHLPIRSVEKQGHDNRTYRLGNDLLIRMPTDGSYALKVPKEQKLLPLLAPHLSTKIPVPIKMGAASAFYPYPFSLYKWLPGVSSNLLVLNNETLLELASDLAKFLKELQSIKSVHGPKPGQHNWWRGEHLSVYDDAARRQIAKLVDVINSAAAITAWEEACKTKWNKDPVWIHGDLSVGNILIENNKLSAVIDFGGMALGDPACDLVIAWTYLKEDARNVFIKELSLDEDTWLRARGWALWKATYELCHMKNTFGPEAEVHLATIEKVLNF